MKSTRNSDLRILRLLPAATAAVLIALSSACNSSGCLDMGTTLPLAGFYDYSTRKAISVAKLEVRGVGAPADTVLHSGGDAISEIYLPMKADAAEIGWIFDYTAQGIPASRNDTVTFDYRTIPYFASEACGAMYVYRVTRVAHTRHLIDSIGLLDSLFNNVDTQRIRIFFRTDTDEEAASI